MADKNVIPTEFTVFDGDENQPVFLVPGSGKFLVSRDDAGDTVVKDSMAELREYFENVVKRKEARAKRADAGKGYPVTVILRQFGESARLLSILIRGISGRDRILTTGLPRGERVDGHYTVYRQFTEDERAHYALLAENIERAQQAQKDFLEERELGTARHVATAVENGRQVIPEAASVS